MSSDYLGRLLGLSFAAFFLLHTALAALLLLAAPAALRRAAAMRPRAATRFLLFLRLSPAVAASLVVVALCIPSYLWFEPRGQQEEVGILCAVAAALGILQWLPAVSRASAAAVRSLAFGRGLRRRGLSIRVPGQHSPVWIVDSASPLFALSGVWRSALFLSRGVFHSLAPEELDAALRHEHAHRRSHDNLKRLALLAAPELLPFSRRFAPLERAWLRFSEWAADDEAAAGDPARALSLASALVRVARLGTSAPPPLAASLTECGCGLEVRVARLLQADSALPFDPAGPLWPRRGQYLLAGALAAFLLLLPGALAAVHGLLEKLVR
ncbi:MAG TPA: hypothetical protein VLW54_07880 [Candidatus Acidoferrales bacterium]|nr:hypothetical protein [Candidatus Acidoferrales bacterium]